MIMPSTGAMRLGDPAAYETEQHTIRSTQTESLRLVGAGVAGSGFRTYYGDSDYVWMGETSDDDFTQYTDGNHNFRSTIGWNWGYSTDFGETTQNEWMSLDRYGMWIYNSQQVGYPVLTMRGGSDPDLSSIQQVYYRERGTAAAPTDVLATTELMNHTYTARVGGSSRGAMREVVAVDVLGAASVDPIWSLEMYQAGVAGNTISLSNTQWNMNSAERAMDVLWRDSRGLDTLSYDDTENILVLNGMSVEEDELPGGGAWNGLPYWTYPDSSTPALTPEHGDFIPFDDATDVYVGFHSNGYKHRINTDATPALQQATATTTTDEMSYIDLTAALTLTMHTPAHEGKELHLLQTVGTTTFAGVTIWGLSSLLTSETVTLKYSSVRTRWEVR